MWVPLCTVFESLKYMPQPVLIGEFEITAFEALKHVLEQFWSVNLELQFVLGRGRHQVENAMDCSSPVVHGVPWQSVGWIDLLVCLDPDGWIRHQNLVAE